MDSKPDLYRKVLRRRYLMEQAMDQIGVAIQFYKETLEDMGMCDHEVGICMCEAYEQMHRLKHIITLFKQELNDA